MTSYWTCSVCMIFEIVRGRARSAPLGAGILADLPPRGMACVLLFVLRTHDDTRRSALYGWAQGPTSVRGRKLQEERIPKEGRLAPGGLRNRGNPRGPYAGRQ